MYRINSTIEKIGSTAKPLSYKILLSPYHQTFYHDWLLDQSSSKYNITFDQNLSKDLDHTKLNYALKNVVMDLLLFNSHIQPIEKKYFWVQNSRINELQIFPNKENSEDLLKFIKTPFDLENGPLYRFGLFSELDGSYRLLIIVHHILIDGMVFNDFLELISSYYNIKEYKFNVTLNKQIEAIEDQTNNFSNKMDHYAEQSRCFWQNNLHDITPIDLKFAKIHSIESNQPYKEINFHFSDEEWLKLAKINKKYSISIYAYSKIVFAILLSRYTLQQKFGLAYSIAIKNSLGLFSGANVNTAIFPFEINQNTSNIINLIQDYKKFTKAIKSDNFNYGYYPIGYIIQNCNKDFLNIMFTQTNLKQTKLKLNNIEVLRINNDYNFDNAGGNLLFEQEIIDQTIYFRVRYNENIIDTNIINNFINQYVQLFKLILNDLINDIDNKPIKDYQILSKHHYEEIIYQWNANYEKYPDSKTIHQLFEEQVNKNPDNIAIISEDESITYTELNQKSNQLANYFKQYNDITIEDPIIVFLDRSPKIIITLLAILKSGCSYVPIDSHYPKERVHYILEQTKTKLVITNKKYELIFDKLTNINVLYIDNNDQLNLILKNSSSQNLNIPMKHNNLAYITYTSGTTGNPKGVMVGHHNVVSLVRNVDYVKITHRDCFLQLGNLAFDASVFEIWGALINGAKVYISKNIFNILSNNKSLQNIISYHNISILFLTKTIFDQLYLQNNSLFKPIKYLLIGGEALDYNTIKHITNSDNKPKHLINIYGPTENTTFSCGFEITKENIANRLSVPIGRALNNRHVYILDYNLNIMPIGAIGELYLGGAGLARGYLNAEKLTNEKFINNPWQNSKYIKYASEKLYKTGDLARWLPNGDIEYIGRNDLQIKIRGYRIEINEIENIINQYPNIKGSIVTTYSNIDNNDKSKDQYLIAYYLASSKINEAQLSDYLLTYLPDYMLPNQFILIDKIPLTLNGKLDMKSLPKPQLLRNQSYMAPNNQIEFEICKSYAEILNLPINGVGINHDFFKIGGNSILAIQLVAKLQHNFKLNINDVFKFKTPAKIAQQVEFSKDNLNIKLSQIKFMYEYLNQYQLQNKNILSKKKKNYIENIKKIEFSSETKSIKNVLLTGSTGHLGCYILFELLMSTSYDIILLIRATSIDLAYCRIKEKFKYYFDIDLDLYLERISIVAGDIEKNNLNLQQEEYQILYNKVDSIIHVAALVKHYGHYNEFYQANVQATVNLLELSKLTKLKDFHYISTVSIFMDGYIPNTKYYEFCEDDNNSILTNKTHIYSQTKYEGETKVIEYRKYGLNSNIYRVANLAVNSKGHSNQYDITSNAFFVRLKTFLLMKMIPKEYLNFEISPVDYTALAIIKLFDKLDLCNQTYHIFNPNHYNMSSFINMPNINIEVVNLTTFIDKIKDLTTKSQLEQYENDLTKQIKLFMLHQSWLAEINTENLTYTKILQDKTNFILEKVNFKWPTITNNMLLNIFKT